MKSPRKPAKPVSGYPRLSPGQERWVEYHIRQGVLDSSKSIPPGVIICNPDKVRSSSLGPAPRPLWYADLLFVCKDCRKIERWTARQQQWWYEIAGGDIEQTAVRCRACRIKKRTADAESTKRLREHRAAKAQKRAAAFAKQLAAAGPDARASLEAGIHSLALPPTVEEVLLRTGLKTVGDLVTLEAGMCLPGLWEGDMRRIRTLLERQGLTFIGAPVPRT